VNGSRVKRDLPSVAQPGTAASTPNAADAFKNSRRECAGTTP
jgi:hypothetical protein